MTMNEFELLADVREGKGTGENRRLRHAGKVPGVLYGAEKDPVMITLDRNRLSKQLENEAFHSHILTIAVGKEKEKVVLKDVQRDPATAQILHMDLQRVSDKKKLHMHVPLHFINEERAPGKKEGGMVTRLMVEVEISCLPKDLPEYIEVDLGELDLGQAVHLSEVKAPDGVEIYALGHGQDQPVVTIQMAHELDLGVDEVEEEVALEGEEGLEGVEGVEGVAAEAGEAPADAPAEETGKG